MIKPRTTLLLSNKAEREGRWSGLLLPVVIILGAVVLLQQYWIHISPSAVRHHPVTLPISSHDTGGKNASSKARTIFDSDLKSLDALAEKISSGYNRTKDCNAVLFGAGWGEHMLCTPVNLQKPCYFYSFGIAHDYSFDKAIAEKLGCFGFAADPTVTHPALLSDKITFHYLAGKNYHDEDNRRWMFYTSMPGLRKWLGHERVTIIKMDCEGCEYSLAGDILEEDPDFFKHVDQFAVEVHHSRKWMKGREEFYSWATLLDLLQEAGLEFIDVHNTQCAPADQATGLVPELEQRKVKMGLNGPNGESEWGKYGHCHNYLFARLPKP